MKKVILKIGKKYSICEKIIRDLNKGIDTYDLITFFTQSIKNL